jgi:hypothetical protein
MRLVQVIFSLILINTTIPAHAASKNEILRSCLSAIETNDQEKLREEAENIKVWKNLFSDELKIKGAECLSSAFSEMFVYNAVTGSFVSGTLVQTAVDPKEARRREQAFIEAKARYETALKSVEYINDALIAEDIYRVCSDKYLSEPAETLLNELCLSSFKSNGHPNLMKALDSDGEYSVARDAYERAVTGILNLK